jgi:acyl-homoserine lactone acylase PvdQ
VVLNDWDRRNNLESRGAHLFREFWRNVAFTETTENAFRIPFDEADPINTPSGLIINAGTRQALGEAIKLFQDRGVALDATLGELQYVVDAGANDERIPMHGGLGRDVEPAPRLALAGETGTVARGALGPGSGLSRISTGAPGFAAAGTPAGAKKGRVASPALMS